MSFLLPSFQSKRRQNRLSCFQAISRRFWGVFVLYFWWGFVQSEDPCQIRWEPQMLSFPASALVENHVLAAFEGFWRISRRFWRESSFSSFGGVLYKTKALAKFAENRKYYRSPLLLQARIMFDLFSSDFKTILKGSSFRVSGLRFVPIR